MAGLGLFSARLAPSQTLTTLHSFSGDLDGANPYAGLVLSGNTLYGTASNGRGLGEGTVFKLNTDGTGFTVLHRFTGGTDGSNIYAGLILSGNTLYGAAEGGGGSGSGKIFAVNTDGTGYKTLYDFSINGSPFLNTDGANPYAGLILSGNTLYGTAYNGGSSGYGTVFSITTNGTAFATLYTFAG
jgi:uncharacterized repeat protein (TIGR03803 family)